MRTIDDATNQSNQFDAIRLLATIGVVFSHSYPATQGSDKAEPLFVLTGGQATTGGICVAVFFIVSGFLISRSFDRSNSIVDYFVNRAVRIIPALLVVSLLLAFVLGPLVTTEPVVAYWTNRSTWRYAANGLVFAPVQELPGVFADHVYPLVTNASIWTLVYEFNCYIAVAAFGCLLKGYFRAAIFCAAVAWISLGSSYIDLQIFKMLGLYFTGGVLAYVGRKYIPLDLRLFVLAALALVACALAGKGFKPALCVGGAYCVFYVAFLPGLRLPDVTRFGDLSYGTYLYAWPVQQLFSRVSDDHGRNFLMSLPVVLLLAACSWWWVERPCMARRGEIAAFLKRRRWSVAAPA